MIPAWIWLAATFSLWAYLLNAPEKSARDLREYFNDRLRHRLRAAAEFFVLWLLCGGLYFLIVEKFPGADPVRLNLGVFFLFPYLAGRPMRISWPAYAVVFGCRLFFLQQYPAAAFFFSGLEAGALFSAALVLAGAILDGQRARFLLTPPPRQVRGLPVLFFLAGFLSLMLSGLF
ncbi:MAG: hypothetical protein A2Z83_02420 [Omnitrophica bacterium GWA2_52_8]|nr:MAG: hypothetical protein A2Z83_02420 [Omnitrophica bacterium GWA2_52_8]